MESSIPFLEQIFSSLFLLFFCFIYRIEYDSDNKITTDLFKVFDISICVLDRLNFRKMVLSSVYRFHFRFVITKIFVLIKEIVDKKTSLSIAWFVRFPSFYVAKRGSLHFSHLHLQIPMTQKIFQRRIELLKISLNWMKLDKNQKEMKEWNHLIVALVFFLIIGQFLIDKSENDELEENKIWMKRSRISDILPIWKWSCFRSFNYFLRVCVYWY